MQKRNLCDILLYKKRGGDLEVKDLIKKRRMDLGLTFEQIGDYVGVKKGTVQKWESGFIENLRRDKIAKLAEILKISPLEIIYDDIEKARDSCDTYCIDENRSKKVSFNINPELDKLIIKAQQLNPKGIEALEKQADLLLLSDEYRKFDLIEEAI